MLVLSRKALEQIQIGDNVVVTILQVKGQTVRIGIEAPRDVRVLRSELPRIEGGARLQALRAADSQVAVSTATVSPAAVPNTDSQTAAPQTGESAKPRATKPKPVGRPQRPMGGPASATSAPLANRLEARRSPRLPPIDDFGRRAERMELAASASNPAVRY